MYQTLYDDTSFMILIVFWQHKNANLYTIMQLNYTKFFLLSLSTVAALILKEKPNAKTQCNVIWNNGRHLMYQFNWPICKHLPLNAD